MKKTPTRLPTVSIGICAYNEAGNIRTVLHDILSQRQDGWRLGDIIVNSDGSRDATVSQARSVHHPRLCVMENRLRRGKSFRCEQLCRRFSGDILVLFDGDVRLRGPRVVSSLVSAFSRHRSVMLVGGNSRPFPPETFFQRAVYATFQVFDSSRRAIKGGNNPWGCCGSCLAVGSDLARTLRFPHLSNEDDYLYFSCLKSGYRFVHVRRAIVYYKLPKTIRDYLRQIFRSNPEAVSTNFTPLFGDMVRREYHRPFFFYLSCVLGVFRRNPVGVLCIILIHLLCKPFYPFLSRHYRLSWSVASSTK